MLARIGRRLAQRFSRLVFGNPMLKRRESSARALDRKRFEAAMRSPPVLKLILEKATTEQISVLADSSPYRVRAWLKARGLLRERCGAEP